MALKKVFTGSGAWRRKLAALYRSLLVSTLSSSEKGSLQNLAKGVLIQNRSKTSPMETYQYISQQDEWREGKAFTDPQHLTTWLSSHLSCSIAGRSNKLKSGCWRRRCQASTGVISPLRVMLDERLSSSLMMAALAVQVESGCGGPGARDIRGVEAIKMWLDGSCDVVVGWGMCGMHGCSRARTKSMATSGVSRLGFLFTSTSPENLSGWRLKSCSKVNYSPSSHWTETIPLGRLGWGSGLL